MDTNTILLIGLGVVFVLSALGIWIANRDTAKLDDVDRDDADLDTANRDDAELDTANHDDVDRDNANRDK